jgi:peroxiredoxin
MVLGAFLACGKTQGGEANSKKEEGAKNSLSAKPAKNSEGAKPGSKAAEAQNPPEETDTAKPTPSEQASGKKNSVPSPVAQVGQEAPDFTLTGVDGKEWNLHAQRGKVVVLEWFNPECPFVKTAHNEGQLKNSASELAKKGVVWVAINSNAKGKQGFGKEVNLAGQKAFNLSHPVLLDPSGAVGKLYRATRTPHMMVVDAEGKLAYRGALDNTGGGDAEDAPMGVVINYVEKAVGELLAGKAVTESEVRPWGCGVKYGK